MNDLTRREIGYLDNINTETEKMKFGSKFQEVIDGLNGIKEIVPGTPVNGAYASETLTVSGVVIDGETVTIDNPDRIGVDVYEFAADDAQSVGEGNIPVDIVAATVKSAGVLTVDTQPTSGDTMTIGGKVYIFVPDGTATADGEVSIGGTVTPLLDAQANIVAAINGVDGVNNPNPAVSADAFVGNDCAITALVGGVAGDLIDTTSNFTAIGNAFGAVTLQNGSDCSAADAITALVAAITASDTQRVGAADGAGDTVDLTSDTIGVYGNSIAISTDMANGSFPPDVVALSGGVDGTVADLWTRMVDDEYLYVRITDGSWRRISLGAVY